jgi:hypothetical protein
MAGRHGPGPRQRVAPAPQRPGDRADAAPLRVGVAARARAAVGDRGRRACSGPRCWSSLLASKSRNAWLTMGGVAFVWSLLVLGWRGRWGSAVAGAGGGGGAARVRPDGRARRGRATSSVCERDGRVGLWLVALAMFRESPWLGKGVFTFGEYYRPSWYAFRVIVPRGVHPRGADHPLGAQPRARDAQRARGRRARELRLSDRLGAASVRDVACASRAWRRPRRRSPGFLGASLVDLTLMKDWVALMLFLLLAVLWWLAERDWCEAKQTGNPKNVTAPAGAGAAAGGNRVDDACRPVGRPSRTVRGRQACLRRKDPKPSMRAAPETAMPAVRTEWSPKA